MQQICRRVVVVFTQVPLTANSRWLLWVRVGKLPWTHLRNKYIETSSHTTPCIGYFFNNFFFYTSFRNVLSSVFKGEYWKNTTRSPLC